MDYSNNETISKMTELLTMLKTMSSGYDPMVSSESDPLVVLLKEIGMSEDQITYLKDKAVGELMPSRVQQRENAQELYSCLGYNIKKYRSATGRITMKMRDVNDLTGNSGVGIFLIPRFTRVGDASGMFEYVTTEKVQWTTNTAMSITTIGVMEGKLKQLQVGGSNEIKLVNLDENYRMYFPETNIAENGIFISLSNGEEFTRKDNIFALSDQNIYYVGEDEGGEIYVQFQSTIVNLLGNGGALNIRYLVTDGAKGNCKIGTLTTILDEITDSETNESITAKIIVGQAEPINNGSDPESINNMYRNFKKVQNTFGTLVTEKDYEGAAFLAEHDRIPLWSNVVVASRLNDLNQTVKIKTLSNFKTKDYYRLINRDDSSEMGLKVSTIFVYGLTEANNFDALFVADTTSGALSIFQNQVLEDMAINQDIRYPQQATGDADLQYGFLNTFFLSGTILLKNTVNKTDAATIKDKIMQNLEYVYAARQREFGKEIDYQEAVETIINSDGRIKTIALSIPKYQIRNMSATSMGAGTEKLTDVRKTELIAKMILSGNIQLFKHDKTFELVFGQKATVPKTNIIKIATKAGNKSGSTDLINGGYTLKKNEVVQVKGNKYRTTVEYGALVNYKFIGNGGITITEETVLSGNAILAAGSKVACGSVIYLNITLGTITEPLPARMYLASGSVLKAGTVVSNGSTGVTPGTLANNTTLAAAAMLEIGSQIATGSSLVIGPTDINIDHDYIFHYGSGIAKDSILALGSIIKEGSTYNGDIVSRKLIKDSDNLLIPGDVLYIKYNDGGVIKYTQYESGDVIRPSFDLYQTLESGDYPKTLVTGQSISIRKKAEGIIPKGTLVYFIGKNRTLTIPGSGLGAGTVSNDTTLSAATTLAIGSILRTGTVVASGSIGLNAGTLASDVILIAGATLAAGSILKAGSVVASGQYELKDTEYLLYTNPEKDELVIINPGTVIKNNSTVKIVQVFGDNLDPNDMSEYEETSIEWQQLPYAITAVDQEIFSFGEGVTVISDTTLSREWASLTSPIIAIDSDGNSKVFEEELTGISYRARIILNLVASPEQMLLEGQSVIMTDESDNETEYIGTDAGVTVVFDSPTVALGGEDNIIDADNAKTATSYTDELIGNENIGSNPTATDGVLYITKEVMSAQTIPNELTLPFSFNSAYLVNVSINTLKYGSTETPAFAIKTRNGTLLPLSLINGSGVLGDNDHLMAGVQADYQCLVPPGSEDIIITAENLGLQNYMRIGKIVALKTDDNGIPVLNVDDISVVGGSEDYNDTVEDAYDAEAHAADILAKVNNYGMGMYDYGYVVPDGKKVTKPTRSSSYWNAFHIGNKYTIAKLDLEKTKTELVINPSQVI